MILFEYEESKQYNGLFTFLSLFKPGLSEHVKIDAETFIDTKKLCFTDSNFY